MNRVHFLVVSQSGSATYLHLRRSQPIECISFPVCLFIFNTLTLPISASQEEAEEAAAKCGVTLSSLEGDAAEVDALKKGLDRRHRQAEKEAAELAVREQDLARCGEGPFFFWREKADVTI